MSDLMSVALGAAALAEKLVNRMFDAPKKVAEPTLFAPGLAVGYYFNFLDVVARQLEVGKIKLSESADAGDKPGPETEFDLANTNIQIIMPAYLRGESFQRCSEEFSQTLRGSIYLNAQGRYYGINYRVFKAGDAKKLTIVDLARPAMVLKRCYEDMVRNIDTDPNSKDGRWRDLQQLKLAAFETTIRKMQARGYEILANKLDIVRRG
jgi:hypothetical protein